MWRRLRQPRVSVDAHVISFGNITAGGTGKTPAVIERTKQELALGKKVAVLTRGYGNQSKEHIAVARGEQKTPDLYLELGDEPALIASKAPDALVIRCADRIKAARKAIDEFGCDTLIMDDAYQHVQLERDENIVVVDASNPFGNGHMLPRGILREPLTALDRATHVLLTRCDQCGDLEALEARMAQLCSGAPLRKTCHAATSLWRLHDNTEVPLDTLNGTEVHALCAIGNPESFFEALEALGAQLIEKQAFPDHTHISREALPASGMVVTTEKDAMRIAAPPENVHALGIELRDM